jgi:hypothetical protein
VTAGLRRVVPRSLVSVVALVAAVVLLGLPVGPTAPTEVRAATPDLTIVSKATYDVQPDDRRVRVTVDLTLNNRLRDTKTKRYYFDHAFLAVLPQASGYKLTWTGKGTPNVRVTKSTKQYRMLRLGFGARLYSGKTAHYTLRFDLKDPGGSATRDLRVGDSLVSFPVWAYATDSTPGSSVSIRFPTGYDVEVQAGDLPSPTTDAKGRTVYASGRLDKPLSFFAYLVADRPGSYIAKTLSIEVDGTPAQLLLRSWPDDASWSKRVGGLLQKALPVLGDQIGMAWPHDSMMTVQEAVSRSTGGYAGLFDPGEQRVEIAYFADDFVVLHEAAHGWFNGSLLADRWANEAFASHYAQAAAKDLKLKTTGDVLTDALKAQKIPLNAWGPVGTEGQQHEAYAYAASLALADAIADRAGDDALRAVWAVAADKVGAYQPVAMPTAATAADPAIVPTPELVTSAPDWRGLLDLLEDETGKPFDDLWRTWVARPEDLTLLDAREATRAHYAAVVAKAGDWTLPLPIREAMRAWRFDDADTLLASAETSLAQRDTIAEQATAAGLRTPDALRTAFEDGDGFDDTSIEAAAELEAIRRYREAAAARPTTESPVLQLGLWNEAPDARLAAARVAFEQGDLAASAAAADAASAAWSTAGAVGQGRAFSLGLLALAVVLAVLLLIGTIRRRRHRQPARGRGAWLSD